MTAEPKTGRELDRTVELDAFGLDAARGEMTPRDLGIFGGDLDMAPARRIVAATAYTQMPLAMSARLPAAAQAKRQRQPAQPSWPAPV